MPRIDLRALITELADELDHNRQCLMDNRRLTHPLADKARAALAEPEPEGPTVMEIIELADEIEAAELGQVDLVRAALTRWGRPAPEPVTDQSITMNYETAVNESYSRIPSSDQPNQRFRANLAAHGLCLSVAHQLHWDVIADRYPNGVPFFAPSPWPCSPATSALIDDGWPDDAQVVWLDHPGAIPL